MNDLYVVTADADASLVMNKVLSRHQALAIRPLSFRVIHLSMHDPGVVNKRLELVERKNLKEEYDHIIYLWDHEGSGREKKDDVETVQNKLTESLNKQTWSGKCLTIAIQPELEEWLWHSPHALLKVCKVEQEVLDTWCAEFAEKNGITVEVARQKSPKEMFEDIFYRSRRRRPRPGDFEQIASMASLSQWQQSPSFQRIADTLRHWFPAA